MNARAAAEPQCADAVLMVRPARFGANPETAESNRFQRGGADAGAAAAAQREFDGLVARLRAAGVEVHVADDTPEPPKPDACFPNNWVSFHADGTAVLYPMMAPSRRAERRPELIERLRDAGFRVARTLDLSGWEARGEFLEGTGSLVLDRCHRVAYACRSPRTTPAALGDFAARLGYRTVVFDARGPAGEPLYHTNVMLAIGEGFAVVCADAMPDAGERAVVLGELATAGHEPIEIGADAMHGFAGNLLALRSRDGSQVIALSETAWVSVPPAARAALERHGRVVAVAIPVIERHGGGSVRCMIAEVFLPREGR
ncbi:MAG TPA: arginine deiminase-related protein [Steroidobacteraceae bacterium]|jgi:hypothetical protein